MEGSPGTDEEQAAQAAGAGQEVHGRRGRDWRTKLTLPRAVVLAT
jgi:hypothetical protein